MGKYSMLFLFAGMIVLSSAGCEKTFQNYDGSLPQNRVAEIQAHGLRLYLIGAQREYFDRLLLDPGDYLIGFVQPGSRMSGVARCIVRPGIVYRIQVSGRVFLKKSKSWMLRGECRVLPPEKDS